MGKPLHERHLGLTLELEYGLARRNRHAHTYHRGTDMMRLVCCRIASTVSSPVGA